jgi:CheY-like chemotaxis protein
MLAALGSTSGQLRLICEQLAADQDIMGYVILIFPTTAEVSDQSLELLWQLSAVASVRLAQLRGTASAAGTRHSDDTLSDWLADRQIAMQLQPEQQQRGISDEVAAGIRSLTNHLLPTDRGNGIQLSSSEDDRYRYFRFVAPGRGETQGPAPEHWRPLATAQELPADLRSLPGDYQLRTEGESFIGLWWRLPHVGGGMPAPSQRLRILGVDDQEVIRELLVNMVTGMGHEIVTATTATEGMQLFAATDFDLVIVEMDMLAGDGIALAEQIKAKSPPTPIVMLAGWDREETVAERTGTFADIVITKPFKMEQLGEAIADASRRIFHHS